ncbi:hypothetical protein FJ364_02675 [Candidatus Dependentiae bacterium]|nr:hypothetical protein [Candidatus Dependentiae bacterium]
MKKYVVALVLIIFSGVGNSLLFPMMTFGLEVRAKEFEIFRECDLSQRFNKIVEFLEFVCSAKPGPGSSIAQEVYYSTSLSKNYWDDNVFAFTINHLAEIKGTMGVALEVSRIADLKKCVDTILDIFNPHEELDGSCITSGSDTHECSSLSSALPSVHLQKHKTTNSILMQKDENAYDYALKWSVSMYALFGWEGIGSVSLLSSSTLFSAACLTPLRTWRDGDVFSISLRASALHIFLEVEPFLDWLHAGLNEELKNARTALLAVTSTLEDKVLRLRARQTSLKTIQAVTMHIHKLVADIPEC